MYHLATNSHNNTSSQTDGWTDGRQTDRQTQRETFPPACKKVIQDSMISIKQSIYLGK